MRIPGRFCRSILLALFIIVPGNALAAAPALIPVQGFLEDAKGDVLDGEVSVTFTLYDAPVGGSALHSEIQTLKIVAGAFSAYLGSAAALDLATFRDEDTVFLGIRVGDDSEEMSPRIEFGSVPYAAYAQHAGDAESLGGKVPSDFASAVHSHPEDHYTAGMGLNLSGSNQFSVEPSIIQTRVTGTCPPGQAMRSVGQNGSATCETNIQQRVTGTCGANEAISSIAANGSVTCQSAAAWPPGSYCILKGYAPCPAPFVEGHVHIDTEDNNSANRTEGSIGAMIVPPNNIEMYLCCK